MINFFSPSKQQLKQVKHGSSGRCLELNGRRLEMNTCDTDNNYQRWKFQNYDSSKFVSLE